MILFQRAKAVASTEFLLHQPRAVIPTANLQHSSGCSSSTLLGQLMIYAGIPNAPIFLVLTSFFLGILAAIVSYSLLSLWLIPLTFTIGILTPFWSIDRLISKRALDFAEDFPAVLLATASSLGAGHTSLAAIERAIKLLHLKSPIRSEVEKLLFKLQNGTSQEKAVNEFGNTIRLPELELFRSAFLLSLEHGGRLTPTLERLANVLRDRIILIRSARTATSIMRMTANVMLVITPLVVGSVAERTENFFQIITTHPAANLIGSIGLSLIVINYIILRQMSAFRP